MVMIKIDVSGIFRRVETHMSCAGSFSMHLAIERTRSGYSAVVEEVARETLGPTFQGRVLQVN